MKKIILILMFFALNYMALAQCPPGGIIFSSQQEINDFAVNYPNCTEIQGSVSVLDSHPIAYNDSDIVNLNGLSQISVIHGYLSIGSYDQHYSNPLLNDLTGLSNLTSIGSGLQIARCYSLTDLTPLSGLNTVGDYGLSLHDMPQLSDLSGLEGLSSLNSLSLIRLDNLTDLSGLSGLNTIGSLLLAGLHNITDLSGLNNPLIKGSLTIGYEDYVYYHDIYCDYFFGDDVIWNGACPVEPYLAGNNNFVSLNGINNLDSITSLNIRYNNSLSVCNDPLICNYLSNGGDIDITSNAPGCNSADEVELSCQFECPLGDITFTSQQEVDDFAVNYPNCTEIQGNMTIGNPDVSNSETDITNLNGLSQITTIHGGLNIVGNELLTELTGLESLTSVGGNLSLSYLDVLTDLTGLSGLNNVGGSLSLVALNTISDLTGLNNLTTIGGSLIIGDLYELPFFYVWVTTGNNFLVSLNGLDNLTSFSNLAIYGNSNLAVCNEPFVCNYLSNGGMVSMYENASGCNSTAEVLNSCSPTCTEQDSLTLVSLYNATDGANWNTTWNLNTPIGTWYGVTMSPNGCNVQELNLSNNNLVGTIPAEIGELSTVTRLILHTNSLSGSIPTAIGDLDQLRQIWLFSNQLSGTLPLEIGNLNQLTHLGLGGNQLTGTIPASYGNLNSLGFFTTKNNQLTGCFDDNLANICAAASNSNINSGNNFDALWSNFCANGAGTCTDPPTNCSYADSLILVDLYDATNGANWNTTWNLNQPIDTWHGITLNTDGCVAEINLNSNNLTGTIPNEIGDLAALTRLNMHSNSLLGGIPATIGNLGELRQIWLFNNQLNGTLPPEIGNLIHLTHFGIGVNQLTGAIPVSYGNLSNLALFTLPQNQLSGCFDDNLTNICTAAGNSNINSGNNFDALWSDFCTNGAGSCSPPPTTCNYLDSLSLVALYNTTNGANWTTTWNLTQPMSTWYGISLNTDGCVREVYLPNNNLTGTIPPELGSLVLLDNLTLSANNLSGSIPPELRDLDKVQLLALNNNQLSGSIPPDLGDMYRLDRLHLWNNQLTGSIPPELGNIEQLNRLSVYNNQLNGSIPPELGNLNNLVYFVVHNNQLSGCFDENLLNICSAGSNARVNDGNNFDALWSDFCANGNSCSSPPTNCSYADSLALIDLYNATNGANWTNTWNTTQPIHTWYGVTINANGCVQELNLSNNNLIGTIPASIGGLSELERLNLHTNNLSGTIPATVGNLSELRQIWLFTNQLSGALPPEIGNLASLTHLGIGNNQLSGSIPDTYGNLSNLGFLTLKNNNLSGCYDANLANICVAGNDSRVSNGNNFSASWSAFCTNLTGCCNCRLGMSDDLIYADENLIHLYPNPANQFINIEIQTKVDSELNYVIYNTLGKTVQSGQIRGQAGTHPYPIELNGLNTGIYYFNLMINDKQVTKNFAVVQ